MPSELERTKWALYNAERDRDTAIDNLKKETSRADAADARQMRAVDIARAAEKERDEARARVAAIEHANGHLLRGGAEWERRAVVAERALEEARAERDGLGDLLELAWGVIANANRGDWDGEASEWRTAAERWRDEWHKVLKKAPYAYAGTQAEVESLKVSLSTARAALEDTKAALSIREFQLKDYDKAISELHEARAALREMEEEAGDLRDTAALLRADLSMEKAKCVQAQEELGELDAEAIILGANIRDARAALEAAQRELASMRETAEVHETAALNLARSLEAAQGRIEELERGEQRASAELRGADARTAELRRERDEARKALEAVQGRVRELEKVVEAWGEQKKVAEGLDPHGSTAPWLRAYEHFEKLANAALSPAPLPAPAKDETTKDEP